MNFVGFDEYGYRLFEKGREYFVDVPDDDVSGDAESADVDG